MKKHIIYILFFSLVWGACTSSVKTELRGPQTIKGAVYGDSILDNNVRNIEGMIAIMYNKPSLKLKVRGIVEDVCKKKGCWVTVKLPNGENMRVTFKDYAFFVPKDIKGKEIVVDGFAKTDSISVQDQIQYAEESGLSKAEIKKITMPKVGLTFEAKGLVIL
jgi:hypothetical protein